MRSHSRLTPSAVATAAMAVLTMGVLALALVAAGCGSSTPAASPSPVASPTQSTTGQMVMEYAAYYKQVKPIFDQVSATLATLDGTVSGLSDTPDKSWTTSADKMAAAAQELTAEATALSQIIPPATLAAPQATVVTGLADAQKILDETAMYLDKRVADPNMPDIKTTIETEVKAKLQTTLAQAITDVMAGMSGTSPAPTATP